MTSVEAIADLYDQLTEAKLAFIRSGSHEHRTEMLSLMARLNQAELDHYTATGQDTKFRVVVS